MINSLFEDEKGISGDGGGAAGRASRQPFVVLARISSTSSQSEL